MCVGGGKVLPFVSQVAPGNTAQHSVPPSLDLLVGKGEGKGVCVWHPGAMLVTSGLGLKAGMGQRCLLPSSC